MGRLLGIEYPDAFYHITARGNERQNIKAWWQTYTVDKYAFLTKRPNHAFHLMNG